MFLNLLSPSRAEVLQLIYYKQPLPIMESEEGGTFVDGGAEVHVGNDGEGMSREIGDPRKIVPLCSRRRRPPMIRQKFWPIRS